MSMAKFSEQIIKQDVALMRQLRQIYDVKRVGVPGLAMKAMEHNCRIFSNYDDEEAYRNALCRAYKGPKGTKKISAPRSRVSKSWASRVAAREKAMKID